MPTSPEPPARSIDELCDDFERGWRAGNPVPLENVVRSAPEPLRPELFRRLLAIEGEHRARLLRPVTASEAEERFAGLGPWARAAIGEILSPTGSWAGSRRSDPAGAPAPPPGGLIGRYEIFGRLGHGGHGAVFKARHTRLKRVVALKILFPQRAQTHEGVERFHREMEALGRLSHPNVVAATDAGEANGHYYLAMELVDGTDLARVLKAAGRLRAADACEVVRQAAEGLAYIDRNDMVHRDVKPSNLLLGRDGVVRVLDLGLVRLGESISAERFTETGALMGTADFMAPEQARGSRDADIRADVYSLGCTLFALLTGAPPFAGPEFDTVYDKLRAHNEAPVPPVADLCPGVPDGLARLVGRMLAKDPADRPQSPAEVARDIASFCAGHDLPRLLALVPPDAGDSPDSPPAFPLPLAGAGATAQDTATITEPGARRRGKRLRLAAAAALLAAGALGGWLALRSDPAQTNGGNGDPNGGAKPPGSGTASGGQVPPPLDPPEPQPRTLQPGEWLELLDRPPTVLAWPNPPGDSERRLEDVPGGKKILRVNSTDLAMLQLAVLADAPGYDLEVEFSQNPWVGGVGVFVRGRIEESKTKVFTDTDSLLIQRFDQLGRPEAVSIGRTRTRAYPSLRAVIDGGHPGKVPLLGGREHRLAVTVGASGLEGVSLDGNPAPGQMFDPMPNESPRPGAHGSVGLIVANSSAVFHSVRVRIHPPSPENR